MCLGEKIPINNISQFSRPVCISFFKLNMMFSIQEAFQFLKKKEKKKKQTFLLLLHTNEDAFPTYSWQVPVVQGESETCGVLLRKEVIDTAIDSKNTLYEPDPILNMIHSTAELESFLKLTFFKYVFFIDNFKCLALKNCSE